MADLNKLLVKVPSDLCDDFRTKYLTGDNDNPRDTSYDNKIVFLEDTKDIFSQGKIYGTSYDDFEELKSKVEDHSVTLTFNVNSFSNINEEGSNESDAAKHYEAVSKAYDNGGIVKIVINDGNGAILSNIEKTDTINAMGDSCYIIKGTLCPNSTTLGVGLNKSYNITFKYDTRDPLYLFGYYVSCKEIVDTLYNKKVGGTEIQGDSAGTFMEMIDPGNDTLSKVLKQLLTNDVLIKENSCVNINLSDYGLNAFESLNNISGSYAEDIFNKIKNGYDNGSTIKFSRLDGETSYGAILSNIEKAEGTFEVFALGFVEASGIDFRREIYRGILCPFIPTAFGNSLSLTVGWSENENSYYISCEPFESFGSAAYKNTSYFDKAGAATTAQNNSYAYAYNLANTAYSNAKNYTDSVLPTVSAGNNISVVPSTNANGKINYKVSTTASVFNYKGNKTTIEELQAVKDSYSGDVWSIGVAYAPGSLLYAWDGDEWINIGPADGLKSTSDTASHGVQLSNNSGEVNVTVTPGSIVDGNDSVVTGGAVYSFVNEFKNSLGSAAYKDETYFDKAGTAASAAADVEKKLPGVTNGRGLNVSTSGPDENGKITYTVSTTNEILRYLGDYTGSTPSFESVADGDSYSKDGQLYCYMEYTDPMWSYIHNKKWVNIVGKNLINSVSTTYARGGIRLGLYSDELRVETQPGEIGSPVGDDSFCWNFVTGERVHAYISSLHDSKTSTDGSHVNVTVSTKGGNVSSVSVTESDNLKNAVNNANSALQSVNVLGTTLNKDNNTITVDEAKTALGLGSAAYKDETYFDKAGAAADVEKKLPAVVTNTNNGSISVSYNSDSVGKTTYTISATDDILLYKGNVDSEIDLQESTIGYIYSVKNSLLYRYNGSGWQKIAGNFKEVNETSINGIALKFDNDELKASLGISVNAGKVSSSKFGDGNKLVKGYDVYEAICAHTIKDVISIPENEIVIPEDYAYYIYAEKRQYTDNAYSYTAITLNMPAVYSYVIDNIWEEFSLS